MAKLTRAQRRADHNAAESIRARTIERALLAGLIRPNRRIVSLPPNLEPELAIAERRKMHDAMAYFEAALCAEEAVFHVTWCPADYYFRRGELTADVILRFSKVASRRARDLSGERRRVIGAIDISFNDDIQLWCVHLHALAVLPGWTRDAAYCEITAAFGRSRGGSPVLRDRKPLRVQAINNEEHLINTLAYVSGATVLVDHSDNRRDRRLRIRQEGSSFSSKKNLPRKLQSEVTLAYADLGPSRFWVLSGFKRHGPRVTFEGPPTSYEEQMLKGHQERLEQPRLDRPEPLTFSAAAAPKRLY